MFLKIKYIVVVLFLENFIYHVSSEYSAKAMEGYPSGYLSDCGKELVTPLVLQMSIGGGDCLTSGNKKRVIIAIDMSSPGSNQEAIITMKSLKHISITVQGLGSALSAKKTNYNYFQMRELSNNTDVDFRKKTVLLISGYLESTSLSIAEMIGQKYKNLGYNVLLLDTSWFQKYPYPVAARLMRPVGMHAAEMLQNLTKYGLDPQNLELVGLSLGGQTMSFIAKNFQQIASRNISKLIALEPAGPCFRNLGPNERLDMSDADNVIVVNTNIDELGMAAPVGHVNFYVNGGESQTASVIWVPCNDVCSHVRAFYIWMAALDHPNKFIGIKCKSVQEARERNCYDNTPLVTNILGMNTDVNKTGIFYLSTKNDFPYYLGKKGIQKKFDFTPSYITAYNKENIINAKK